MARDEIEKGERRVGKADWYGLHITRMSLHQGERAKKQVEERGARTCEWANL